MLNFAIRIKVLNIIFELLFLYILIVSILGGQQPISVTPTEIRGGIMWK